MDRRFTEVNRRFDAMQAEMNRRFDAMQTEMNRRFDAFQAENQRQHDAMQEVLRVFEGRTRLEEKAGVRPEMPCAVFDSRGASGPKTPNSRERRPSVRRLSQLNTNRGSHVDSSGKKATSISPMIWMMTNGMMPR